MQHYKPKPLWIHTLQRWISWVLKHQPFSKYTDQWRQRIETHLAHKDVIKDPLFLQHLPDFQDHELIVRTAVSANGYALRFASSRLKDQSALVLLAVKQNPYAIKYASERLQNDLVIALEVVERNGLCVQFLHHQVRQHPMVIRRALEQNPKSKTYLNLPVHSF